MGIHWNAMPTWRVDSTDDNLRLSPVVYRGLGSQAQTWADLFARQLDDVRVFVLFFPSRFNSETDTVAMDALRTFGTLTGARTSVRFWDPTDDEFSRALGLFDAKIPPALVLIPGTQLQGVLADSGDLNVYSLTITNEKVLGNRDQLVRAVNTAHEVVLRGDPAELSAYARQRAAASILGAIANVSATLRDELLKLKPKISLPGGVGIALG